MNNLIHFLRDKYNFFWQKRFIRYAFVSAVALACDLALLVICHDVLGWHYLAAATFGFSMGVVVNYLLGIKLVFNGLASRFASRRVEFGLTAFAATAGLLINDLLLWVLVDKFAIYYLIGKFFAAFAVFFWNYVFRQYYLHSPSLQAAAQQKAQ